jgi:hypothetical protein
MSPNIKNCVTNSNIICTIHTQKNVNFLFIIFGYMFTFIFNHEGHLKYMCLNINYIWLKFLLIMCDQTSCNSSQQMYGKGENWNCNNYNWKIGICYQTLKLKLV